MKSKFSLIINYFIEDAAAYVEAIKTSFDTNDLSGMAASSHALKSSARQVGALKLSQIAREIEGAARPGGETGELEELVPTLKFSLAETITELRNL